MFMAQSKPRSLVRVQSFLNKTNNQINLPTSFAFVCLQFTQKGSAHEALCINLEPTRWAKSYLSRPNDELALVLVPRLHKAQRASRLRKSPRLSQPHKVSESRFLAINTVRFLQNTIHHTKVMQRTWQTYDVM
jgi:hypothetical protein